MIFELEAFSKQIIDFKIEADNLFRNIDELEVKRKIIFFKYKIGGERRRKCKGKGK
jgi:hypothetical protein